MTTPGRATPRAELCLRAVLVGGFLLMLAVNMPGHLSTDSILQLYEGRMGVRDTFGPAIYSRILGLSDDIVPGTGFYVVASGAVLFASLMALPRLRARVSWLAVPLALALVLSPDLLVYQGIVWKDVLFANMAVAGFVCLALAAGRWAERPARWLLLLAALTLFAVAALLRQNGLIAVLAAALALAWTVRASGWKASLAWGLGGFLAVILLSQGLNVLSQPRGAGPDRAMGVGLRILQHYDLVAAAALDPSYPFATIDKANPAADDFMRAVARKVYSPERVDFFDRAPGLGPILFPLPDSVVQTEWRNLILQHPGIYLTHRWAVFRWVFLTPDIARCVPIYVGVSGPPEKLAALGLTASTDAGDMKAYRYSARFVKTPAYSHLSYAIIAVLAGAALLLRRNPADMVVIAMLASALGFAASFFVISLACDYRYLYFLDLAAMAGLLYLAIDPDLGLRRRRLVAEA